jgi:hypothetical protein
MVQTLAPDRTDEPFREGILPRAPGGSEDLPDLHALHTLPKGVAVDRVSIAEEAGWRGVVRERLDDLLGGPGRGGMLGHVEVQDAPPMVGEHDQDEEHAPVSGGHREEVDGDQVADVVREERAPGLRRRGAPLRHLGISRDTVRSATLIPTFKSSPWILGAPHRGLAAAIRATRARISGVTGGRPTTGRRESRVQ